MMRGGHRRTLPYSNRRKTAWLHGRERGPNCCRVVITRRVCPSSTRNNDLFLIRGAPAAHARRCRRGVQRIREGKGGSEGRARRAARWEGGRREEANRGEEQRKGETVVVARIVIVGCPGGATSKHTTQPPPTSCSQPAAPNQLPPRKYGPESS